MAVQRLLAARRLKQSNREESRNSSSQQFTALYDCLLSNCKQLRAVLVATLQRVPGHRNQRQVKGLLRSKGNRARTYCDQNVRSLKPPPPRSSHPSRASRGGTAVKSAERDSALHASWRSTCAGTPRRSRTAVRVPKELHHLSMLRGTTGSTGEKPFRCTSARKCFNQSAHLNTHFRLHTRERASWSRASHSK
ncbi:hypothetical protein D9C73_005988 [Collichthys lucidus]|uniref:C2H2-type domain-containing protein n=1 Tax=Collichthys lucidus TaxID=240159 RepID=A0A4U5U880_COLLU|nr:hypothetical protein D9C73_005988 [Collichthys lucidus]